MPHFHGHFYQIAVQCLLNLYYLLKPAIPQTARFALRHCYALPLRWMIRASWPIRRTSHDVPGGWPGWPNGKSFAFVLSHDVEGRKGLERCGAVAELEMRLGFRSSFNFVPEGEYTAPAAVRALLDEQGFEIGVHDLHHDGSLYRSWTSFREQAKRINHYLAAWGAVGFRSGFMFHNLNWLKDLDIAYDASTFDTDPFEPQPDGVRTIFPFWVPRTVASGYVEMPYTLPQDVSLFLVLKQTNITVWMRKLEWVAAHGGLALLNVHPDYLAFDGRSRPCTYPAKLYEAFLEHVAIRYGDRCWHALGRDVAKYVASHAHAAGTALKAAG